MGHDQLLAFRSEYGHEQCMTEAAPTVTTQRLPSGGAFFLPKAATLPSPLRAVPSAG
jgi:hypothetical protein